MRSLAVILVCLKLGPLAPAQATGTPAVAAPPATVVDGVALPASLVPLYQAWKSESDPARRTEAGGRLFQAVHGTYDDALVPIVDEIARDGEPQRVVPLPDDARAMALEPLTTLAGVRANEHGWRASPVFRRISADRFEVWISREGWLFDAKGRVCQHVIVPRRDGTGREWFGAFLPDGTWITTDLWDNDRQINAFDPQGKWLWEVDGAAILGLVRPANANAPDDRERSLDSLIDWARADRSGRGWLVAVGANGDFECVLLSRDGTVSAPPTASSIWRLVYPRSMGVRGGYVAFHIASDDGKENISFATVAHGPWSMWPSLSGSGGWQGSVYGASVRFGFWPGSHAFFIEVPARLPEPWRSPYNLWSFNAAGRYAGEISGSYLADAADAQGILSAEPDGRVVEARVAPAGLRVTGARTFRWPDGTTAIPLMLADDLRLGFFLRGPGIAGTIDDTRRPRSLADVVLAKWHG